MSKPQITSSPSKLALPRRHFLAVAGGVAGTAAALSLPTLIASAGPLPEGLFTLGVASGDPLPDGVVLWTRLAADPVAPDGLGGMPHRKVAVEWEVGTDETFRRVVRRGTAIAEPAWAHSVHVEVSGLLPDREYWYRFRVGQQTSPVGRTRTAPAVTARLNSLDFFFTSCQNYPIGYFTTLGHIAKEQVDVICHLGDYIYEYGTPGTIGRPHLPAVKINSLADYRVRYGQYKSDPDLMAAHASAPWLVIPDDHEVENNWVGSTSAPDNEPDADPEIFLQRRAVAYRALYEHQPLRRASIPRGPDMQIYRRYQYGNIAQFSMLDDRQFRDPLITCTGDCEGRWDPTRTYLGEAQEKWLLEGLGASHATWQIVGNQAVSFETDTIDGPERGGFSMDNWNGYAAARQRLYEGIHQRNVDNVVLITGDAHRNAAADLKLSFVDPSSQTIGTEFLGTSVSSGGNGTDIDAGAQRWLNENPHIKFANSQRGYQRVRLTQADMQVDYMVVPYVTEPGAPSSRRARITVEAGRQGIADIS